VHRYRFSSRLFAQWPDLAKRLRFYQCVVPDAVIEALWDASVDYLPANFRRHYCVMGRPEYRGDHADFFSAFSKSHMVYQFPRVVTAALSKLTDREQVLIARAWARGYCFTEFYGGPGRRHPAIARLLLAPIVKLALHARLRGEDLFMITRGEVIYED
jgi:hypothetical protein